MKDNPVSKNMRCINKNTNPKQPPLPRNLEKGSCNYFVQDLFLCLDHCIKNFQLFFHRCYPVRRFCAGFQQNPAIVIHFYK